MIDDAITYVRDEVRTYLGLTNQEVITGHLHELKDNTSMMGVFLSLVNLEEEPTLKNGSRFVRQNDVVRYMQPPVFLNLYLLFAFRFQNYGASLLHLSRTVELFQTKPVFSEATAAPGLTFPLNLDKLVFDFFNLNLEQLNYLWSMSGGVYLPSVLYKVRLVRVQADAVFDAPDITTVRVDTVLE
jgi:hypothetical protein